MSDKDKKVESRAADGATVPARRTEKEEQNLKSSITELFEERITFNGFLGFKIASLEPGSASIKFSMRPELVGHYLYGRLHGGVISSVLDATAGLAVVCEVAEFHPHESTLEIMSRFRYLGTVDLRIDYLRQGIGEEFFATAEVTRLGKRIAATSMQLKNDEGSLIATGNATYIVS